MERSRQYLEVFDPAIEGLMPLTKALPEEQKRWFIHESDTTRGHKSVGVFSTVAIVGIAPLAFFHLALEDLPEDGEIIPVAGREGPGNMDAIAISCAGSNLVSKCRGLLKLMRLEGLLLLPLPLTGAVNVINIKGNLRIPIVELPVLPKNLKEECEMNDEDDDKIDRSIERTYVPIRTQGRTAC